MDESKEPRQIQASDHLGLGLTEALGAQAISDGDVKGVRVVDFSGQSLVADLRDDGTVSVRIEGKGVPGGTVEVTTCQILVNRLNRENRRELASLLQGQARPEGIDVGILLALA